MRFDFSTVEDQESYVSIPEGAYGCRVAEVRIGKARDGSERWSYRLEVSGGEFAGRTATWDSLTWSERGIFRVKAVLGALGFDVAKELELEASELIGREAHVQLEREEWEDPENGERRVRLAVPYLGYKPSDSIGKSATNGNGAPKDVWDGDDPF